MVTFVVRKSSRGDLPNRPAANGDAKRHLWTRLYRRLVVVAVPCFQSLADVLIAPPEIRNMCKGPQVETNMVVTAGTSKNPYCRDRKAKRLLALGESVQGSGGMC